MTTQRIEERNECRCPQCVQENNRGNCDRKDCCNYHNPNELVQSITTQRIEEKVAEFRKEYKSVERYSRIGQEDLLCDWLENTLAEAHQAGIDEAVAKIFTWGCGNSLVVPFEDGRPIDVVEWSKLKEIIKALQDKQ